MKITTEIVGADAERLADCIKFAAKHSLVIGEHTQCGINESSGNVWLWDEDWPACIYQTIYKGPSFMWSCPDCGHEFDCSTLLSCEELNEFSNKHDGHCKECFAGNQ